MLPREEWLQDAQALPVGRSERVYHGAEHRQNMLVKNKPEGWSCWCFSCQDGGFVPKEHVRLQEPDEPDVPTDVRTGVCTELYVPSDTVALDDFVNAGTYESRRLVKFLNDKGVSSTILREWNPRVYHDRVVFSFPECIIGRDFTGVLSAKWKVYNGSSKLSYVHLQAKTTDDTREGTQESTVVLTEDILSAIKVRWYTTLPCIALRGTLVRTDTLALILRNYTRVLIFLDGDTAGRVGSKKASKLLDTVNIPHVIINTPDGLDPKDLKPNELRRLCTHLKT